MGRRLGGPSTLMAMGHAGERWGGGNGGVWGGRLVVLDAQSPPGGLSHLSRPPCHGCLALSLSALVTTMVLGKHAQMAGRLGAVTCRALAGRSEQCMDHCHQRGGVHHGLERLADAPVPPGTLLVTTRCRTVQPIGPLASVLGLVLARSLRGKMRRVPSPYARIEDRLREALQPCGRQGCHGTQRDEASGMFQSPVDSFSEPPGGSRMVIANRIVLMRPHPTAHQRLDDAVYQTPRWRSSYP